MNKLTLLFLLFLLKPLVAWGDRVTDWHEDLAVFSQQLIEKHIDPFSQINEKDFGARVATLRQHVASHSDNRIILELMKLTREIGDGHTAVHFMDRDDIKRFPLEIYNDNGAWRVIGVTKQYKNLLGAELTHIGPYDVTHIKNTLEPVVQFAENRHSLEQRTVQFIQYADFLFELGLIEHKAQGNFTFSLGEQTQTIVLDASSTNETLERFSTITPDIEKIADSGVEGLWFGIAKNNKAVYIKFSQYPSFKQMDRFGQRLLTYIRKHSSENIIIDMRSNGGGDFYVGLSLAYYLNIADSIDWLNGVVTLVDNDTFSAATINAAQFKQLLNAKIIGEPTGSNPYGYQDMGTFELPNSGLIVSYSKRLFRLQDKGVQGLMPDVELDYSWDAYSKGEDNMLNWVINQIKTTAIQPCFH